MKAWEAALIAAAALGGCATPQRSSELMAATGACRVAVTEAYAVGGRLPSANGWGCEDTRVSTTEDGAIVVRGYDGKTLTLTPFVNGVPAKASLHAGQAITEWRSSGRFD